jgi:hypothetical protein
VAKRLVESIRHGTNIPVVEYIFNEEDTPLPDLGGIQKTLGKRTRHRRALMRMLFDYYETDRLIVCMDPGNLDLLQDFASDRSVTRLLEIQCDFSEEYMIGHAMRVGLAGEQTSADTLERLLPTIRNDMNFESDALRDAEFEHLNRMRESASVDDNANELAKFLTIPHDKGREIAEADYLFYD